MDKEQKNIKEEQLIALVSNFCQEKLNEEYKQLCTELIKKLGRKRTVPFMTGRLEIWAASVIHTVGMINFLFIKSSKPYISPNDISEYFDTKASTVTGKSKQIRDLLKLHPFSNEFSTAHMNERDPFNNIAFVNGMFVPISSLPEDLQEIAKEAAAQGTPISITTDRKSVV